MKILLSSFVAGCLFSAGLALGGMTQPAKIVGFLDVAGSWDPTLMFVMAGAIAVHSPSLMLVLRRRQRPLLEQRFMLPEARRIDASLIVGAALFGIGWGWIGYCPGPALTSAGAAASDALVFTGAMLAGMLVYRLREAWKLRRGERSTADAS